MKHLKQKKFEMLPALKTESDFFYAQDAEIQAERGIIGHLRVDFGRDGNEFYSSWFDGAVWDKNTPEFKEEFDRFINQLREEGPLKNLAAMNNFCRNNGGSIDGGWVQNHGFVYESENYKYYLRCIPNKGDYNAYVYCVDKREQKQADPKQEIINEIKMKCM